MRLKYSLVPVVAAIRGMAFGGGCEFQMHCARTVAAFESYIGLVEAGVGLLPSGGGLKEIALRASRAALDNDPFPQIKKMFETVAMAKVSGSALEAKQLGLLRESDVVVFNAFELLYVAKAGRARRSPNRAGARRCRRATSSSAGDVGTASLKMMLVNMLEGRFISEHDYDIASRIADTLCGGVIERGSTVDEKWLLDLERKHFVELARDAARRRTASRTRCRPASRCGTSSPSSRRRPGPSSSSQAQNWIPASAGMTKQGTRENVMTEQIQDAYIVSAVRTPVGKAPRGVFRNTRPDDLLAHVLREAIKRAPGIDVARIGDAIIGCAMPEAEQGMNVARIGVLLAGLPDSVPGMTINRFCSSGLQAIALAADRIRLGEADLMLAGGTESMSMVPMMGHKIAMNPAVFADENIGIAYGMGITAEKVAERWKVTREQQDAFALQSHQRALAAIAAGEFADEIAPFTLDDHYPDLARRSIVDRLRAGSTPTKARARTRASKCSAKLKPVFRMGGSVTAGNSSQTSDGAGAVVLASEQAIKDYGLTPLARFVGFAVAGVPPEIMGIGPKEAIPRALAQTGIRKEQLDWIELNEAFAAQSLAVIQDIGLDPAKVNPLGGAIALGHPLGATGAVRVATLVHGLRRRKQKYGMVTMCIGTGMGAAGIFEALASIPEAHSARSASG